MAVNKWYFCIPAQFNIMRSVTFVPPADKDTYLLGYKFKTSDTTNGANFWISGKGNAILNPEALNAVSLLAEPAVFGERKNLDRFMPIKLLNEGNICYTKVDPLGTGACKVMAEIITAELKLNGGDRSMEDVLREARETAGRIIRRVGYVPISSGNVQVIEYSEGSHVITPPALDTLTVATKLDVVSSVPQDAVGGGGAEKIKFKYWDDSGVEHESDEITLTGQTPVNLIAAGYTDVFVIGEARVTVAGAYTVNLGNILFQNN